MPLSEKQYNKMPEEQRSKFRERMSKYYLFRGYTELACFLGCSVNEARQLKSDLPDPVFDTRRNIAWLRADIENYLIENKEKVKAAALY